MNKLFSLFLIIIGAIYCKTIDPICECTTSCKETFNNCSNSVILNKCDCWGPFVKCLDDCSDEEQYGCFNETYINRLCKSYNCPSYQCYFPTPDCMGCGKVWTDCRQSRCACNQQLIGCYKSISNDCYQYNLFDVLKDCFDNDCECMC